MLIFRKRKKETLDERKLAIMNQIEQLKKELHNAEEPYYKQQLQHVINEIVSIHSTENVNTPTY